jgi:GNAT superfamily N-acetyltransferase
MTENDEVTVRFLVMKSQEQLRPSTAAPTGIKWRQVETDRGRVARDCYHIVGRDWHWEDHLDWDVAEWQQLVDEEDGELWTAHEAHNFVGYAQLARRSDSVEIHYFGLTPDFIGRGLGGWILTRAIERCWAMGAERVTLNTCTLDGPAALPNYLARGFSIVREEQRPRKATNGPL